MSVASPSVAEVFSPVNQAYRVLGEGAGAVVEDRVVIRLYEAARAFGEVARALREWLDDDVGGADSDGEGAVAEVLADALASDDTGERALELLANSVGPTVLGLLERLEVGGAPERVAALSSARAALAAQVLAVERTVEGRRADRRSGAAGPPRP